MNPALSSSRGSLLRKGGVKTVAIVPAAGSGKRLSLGEKKPFILLGGKPLISYTLEALASSRYIHAIIVAADEPSIKRLEGIIDRYGIKKVIDVVAGGRTRFESVRNGFNAIGDGCDIVLVHDGARPFPAKDTIRDSILFARKFGACVAAAPVTDTIKLADKNLFVEATLDRSRLWRAETPQAFRYKLLKDALERVKDRSDLTDDASILERVGGKVRILKSSPNNIKVTIKEDLKLAEVLL